MITTVQEIKVAIPNLSPTELAELKEWPSGQGQIIGPSHEPVSRTVAFRLLQRSIPESARK